MSFKKENRSLVIAIVITIVTAVVFLFLFLFLGINHRRDVYNDSKILATEISRNAAFETQVYISSAISTAKSLEQKARLLRKLNSSRAEFRTMLKSAVIENSIYLGTWTLWEPNSFDNKDSLYKEDPLYNNEGTVGLGCFRFNDSIYYEIMTPADYVGPHYLAPKQKRKQVLIEPYKFVYSGYDNVFFGTSVSVPIIIDSKFLGTIGVDIDLIDLQHKLQKIKPYETGYLSLISNNGTIITHADTSFINKNIFNLLDSNHVLCQNSIKDGKELTIELTSEFTNQKVLRMFYPIIIGEENNPWSMMIEIPLEQAFARSRQLLIIAIITLVIGLSLLLYLIVNISERIRNEKNLLMAKNQAEESNRLKTAFLKNISHEIRTPLNGILGFSELLTNCDSDDDQIDTYKDIIRNSSKQLLSIIDNVMELSKIQAQQVKLVIQEFKIEDVLAEVVNMYKKISKEENIELITKFPLNGIEYCIRTDKNKFMQVVSSFLNNSFKFTDSGIVEVGYKIKENSYVFYVMDTGNGIEPENKEKIFNLFTQGNYSSTRIHDGLGVGLTISKSFIDMLGGTINFETEVGKGSTFYFSLPKSNDNYKVDY